MLTELSTFDPIFTHFFSNDLVSILTKAGFTEIDDSIKIVARMEASRLKNFCNTDLVPPELEYLLLEMVLGAFLERMYHLGKIPGDFNVDYIGSRVTLGDTTVEFKGGESLAEKSEKKLIGLINALQNNWMKEAITCRRLKW